MTAARAAKQIGQELGRNDAKGDARLAVDLAKTTPPAKPAHTPGPFVAKLESKTVLGEFWAVYSPSGEVITTMGGGTNPKKRAELHAAELNSAWRKAGGPELLAELRGVEWGGTTQDKHGTWVDACPRCGAEKSEGHDEGCTLAARIAKATGGAA